ncbi:MAG: aminotransferase class III-fold pyridoxal phosphate-dependent enzyme [Planctomycetota bacterium]
MEAPPEGLSAENLLGPDAAAAMRRADRFLRERDTEELLELVGTRRPELAAPDRMPDKEHFPASYGGGGGCQHDLLAGRGMFYVTEDGRVMLDCTSGHYQMTWGYNHPALVAAAREAMDRGMVWDNHSNIPGVPVKRLAERLIELGAEAGLERALLGICTGSVACSTALKIMLARHGEHHDRAHEAPPVMVALPGNYHGTDMVAQTMRGMWEGLLAGLETVRVEPNDGAGLREVFSDFGSRVAGFWAEPVMMNREALVVEADYLRLARELCTEHDALMALDEIQTGFWYPEVLMFRRLGLEPDMVVVGKGMTAGFHPLSGLLYRPELDILEQYDAISTNGNASLAAYVALSNLHLIERHGARMGRLAESHYAGLRELAGEFPELIEAVNGDGFLSGLRFTDRRDALGFHRSAVEAGLWLRAHAYHPGHRTVLMKYPLVVERTVVDCVLDRLRALLSETPWR